MTRCKTIAILVTLAALPAGMLSAAYAQEAVVGNPPAWSPPPRGYPLPPRMHPPGPPRPPVDDWRHESSDATTVWSGTGDLDEVTREIGQAMDELIGDGQGEFDIEFTVRLHGRGDGTAWGRFEGDRWTQRGAPADWGPPPGAFGYGPPRYRMPPPHPPYPAPGADRGANPDQQSPGPASGAAPQAEPTVPADPEAEGAAEETPAGELQI